jgi:hypothetical protein
MKLRAGFVSNSSSSSFVIGIKKGCNLKEELKKVIGLSEEHILYKMSQSVIETIINCAEKKYNSYVKFVNDIYDGEEDFVPKEIKELFKNESFDFYEGSFSDDGGNEIEASLCNTDLNYKAENFIIVHEGGY